jgi:FkbM family methyltransferase
MKNKFLKKIIGIFGYKLIEKNVFKNNKSLSRFTSLNLNKILEILFTNYKINQVIQIGANDGKSFDEINHYIKKNHTNSVLVEPIKNNFEVLKKNYENCNFIKFENSAISVNNEISYLYKVNPKHEALYGSHIPAIPSFEKKHLINHGVKNRHILKEKINSISIKDLIIKYKFNNFDLFFIDAEGYDGKIVYDFLSNLDIRPIIIFEYIHIDNNFFEHLLEKLKDKKYLFFSTAENIVCFPQEKKIKLDLL